MMNDIKYFLAVSETLNITRASEIIGLSQPALSYALKRLENELGGQLLIRLKNGIQLTKFGEAFLQNARRLLHEWEQAQSLIDPESGLIQGVYTFAIHASVALHTLANFMPTLQSSFSRLNFNFIHGLSREMTEKIINWEADFGIVVNPIKHPDLVIHKLYNDEVTIFHTKNAKNKLIYDKNLTQSQYILKKISKKAHFNNGVLSSGNLEVVAKLTALGLGYGLLPTRVAHQYQNLIKLKDAPAFKDEIFLIYRPEKHNNFISKKIIQIIKSSAITSLS